MKPKHLNSNQLQNLTKPDSLNIGSYHLYLSGKNQKYDFIVSLDARPLVTLIEAASYGHRVYELMSIRRPGDLLHYLWLTLVDVDQEVVNYVKEHLKQLPLYRFNMPVPLTALSFLDFDNCFYWDDDDTRRYTAVWLQHRKKIYWQDKTNEMLKLVFDVQEQIKQSSDYLIKHEIFLLDNDKHVLDYLADINRACLLSNGDELSGALPAALSKKIKDVIGKPDVKSVSCFYGGHQLWRLLVEEQLRRSAEMNIAPQDAFKLSGPDHGLGNAQVEQWGGYVHIPYEGMCHGDLVFLPDWRVFRTELAGKGGSLAEASGLNCRYMFTPISRDFGGLGCSSREVVGDWILYKELSKR